MCVAASYLNGGYLHRARMQGPKAGARRSTRRFWAQHASARPPLLRAISLGDGTPLPGSDPLSWQAPGLAMPLIWELRSGCSRGGGICPRVA